MVWILYNLGHHCMCFIVISKAVKSHILTLVQCHCSLLTKACEKVVSRLCLILMWKCFLVKQKLRSNLCKELIGPVVMN